ncbi:MAG: UvrD-helicase domain-containing protein [Clostridiales bacterium]|nr:UvrD-helicase domain-containing protein [Clostridiales bacterium]
MNLQKLNDAQLKAVTAPLAPTLVLAGAGSGKTRVLTNRILYLVQEHGVNPSEILAITFTNKAANEMKRRLLDFHCAAEYMHVSTIHSFCATVLRMECKALNRGSNFSIYDESEKKSVLKQIVKSVFDDGAASLVDGFADSISDIKNNAPDLLDGDVVANASNDDYLKEQLNKLSAVTECSSNEDLLKVIQEYSAKMTENNAMDFDDLLYYVHKLFSNFPDVLDKYRDRFKYILIDEFQDTNKVQYQIFKMLGEKHRNIFVVGDDDQSIYSWRGADAYNLKKFEQDFPDCNVYKLEQNYRSTKRILDVANEIIRKNINRFDKVLWTENDEGLKVQLFSAYNEQDEAYFVCEQIKNIIYLNPDYKLKDFAILMRVNALSRSFEQQFQQNRIPYKVFGGFKFFERREIKDVLAYMRLIHNPYDSEAFERALNVPRKRGIGDASIAKLRVLSVEYGLPMLDVISDERNLDVFNATTRKKLLDFHTLITDLLELSRKTTVGAFVHQMLDILEFRKVLTDMGEEERALNIDEFEESVLEFQQINPIASLSDYLQTVSLSQDMDDADTSDYVTIATIHAVKGLEFKVVFAVGLEEGLFPSSRSTYEGESMQEERRLMYVAATRAEKRLYLTRAQTRFLWGQRKQTLASRYFNEVQQFYAPVRKVASERELSDDRFLDKLIEKEIERPKVSQGRTDSELKQYRVGQIVEHASFGKGIILRIEHDVADVAFDTVGKKSLNMKFAPLKIVS